VYLIALALTGPDTRRPDPDEIVALIQEHAEPVDQVEHVRVRVQPGRIDIAFFLLAREPRFARQAAQVICRRVLVHTVWLTEWRLTDDSIQRQQSF
jgi:hypothetical protein